MGGSAGRCICQVLAPGRGFAVAEPLCLRDSQNFMPFGDALSDTTASSQPARKSSKGNIEEGRKPESRLREGDFEFLRCIGKGSFGNVFLVRKRSDTTGRLLAMKILHKDRVANTRKRLEYVVTERQVLRRANHPFIAQLRYAFQSPTKLYLVTDFFGGGELLMHLRRLRRFTEAKARFFAAEVALGLEYLHQRGCLHRDLKPENVLLDEDGHISLTDFGLSKVGLVGQTVTTTICGTPEYLPPEVFIRAGEGYGCELDWWSFGVILFEMLEGRPPFQDQSRPRLLKLIVNGTFSFRHVHSRALTSLVNELLCIDPCKRLRSATLVKDNPWFASINWEKAQARGLTPPFRPGLFAMKIDVAAERHKGESHQEGINIPGFTYIPDSPYKALCQGPDEFAFGALERPIERSPMHRGLTKASTSPNLNLPAAEATEEEDLASVSVQATNEEPEDPSDLELDCHTSDPCW